LENPDLGKIAEQILNLLPRGWGGEFERVSKGGIAGKYPKFCVQGRFGFSGWLQFGQGAVAPSSSAREWPRKNN
jgi:hypothetical protein